MIRIVCPPTWAGVTKPEAPDVMVCEACPYPKYCADTDRCFRWNQENIKIVCASCGEKFDSNKAKCDCGSKYITTSDCWKPIQLKLF